MRTNLLNDIKITKVAAASTAGTSTVNGTGVEMDEYDGVLFVTTIGTNAAGNYLKAQQDTASAFNVDAKDLTGSQVLTTASAETVAIDVHRPTDLYVRPVVLRGTSTTVGDIFAIQYKGRNFPVGNDTAGVISSAAVFSPAETTIS